MDKMIDTQIQSRGQLSHHLVVTLTQFLIEENTNLITLKQKDEDLKNHPLSPGLVKQITKSVRVPLKVEMKRVRVVLGERMMRML